MDFPIHSDSAFCAAFSPARSRDCDETGMPYMFRIGYTWPRALTVRVTNTCFSLGFFITPVTSPGSPSFPRPPQALGRHIAHIETADDRERCMVLRSSL